MCSEAKQATNKLEVLDTIRGFTALYVVIHHFIGFSPLKQTLHPLLRLPFRFGQEAVIVFFLMSGFVIYIATYKKSLKDFKTFFYKRFFRIYPIFIITLILSFLIATLNNNSFRSESIGNLIGNIFMLQDMGDKPGSFIVPFLKNHALWSLSYEWWFYMLFIPVLLFISRIKQYYTGPSIYIVLLVSCLAYCSYLVAPNHVLLVLTYLTLWWAGVAYAELYCQHIPLTLKSAMPIYVSLLTMLCLTSIPTVTAFQANSTINNSTHYPFIITRHFVFAFICIAFMHLCQLYRINFTAKAFIIFTKLSAISYALYCVHFPILWLKLPFIENIYYELFCKLLLTVGCAYVLEAKLQPVINRYSASLRSPIEEKSMVVRA